MIRAFLKTPLAIIFAFTVFQFSANGTTFPISVTLTGAQEVPANSSTGTATLTGTYNDSTNVLKYTVTLAVFRQTPLRLTFMRQGLRESQRQLLWPQSVSRQA